MRIAILTMAMFATACGGASVRYSFIPVLPTQTTISSGTESAESPGYLCRAPHSRNDFAGCRFIVFHFSREIEN
jgi:hypothetical protein